MKIGQLLADHQATELNIPVYQRLYAWSEKEIKRLLDDIQQSIGAESYYIGNVTLHQLAGNSYFDIIDGQQRLTTLWLIGLVFKLYHQSGWEGFLLFNEKPLLTFTSRDDDNQYLKSLLGEADLNAIYSIHGQEVNPVMKAGIRVIVDYLKPLSTGERTTLSDYVRTQVKMLAIFLPDGIDLNKYFEDMNNRGLQLEAHHYVKAKLLEDLKESPNLSAYAQIWDAVSNMNRYLEYSLHGELKDARKLLLEPNAFDKYVISFGQNARKARPLKDLITEAIGEAKPAGEEKDKKDVPEKLTSIINFPEFLLHVLKIHLGGKGGGVSLDDKKLIAEFRRFKQDIDPEKFFKDLFDCRVLLDAYVIKSVNTDEGSQWAIRQIFFRNNEYIRSPQFGKKVVQIQSMLNVSVTLSYWFTSLLSFLKHQSVEEAAIFAHLENLDDRIAADMKGKSEFEDLLNHGTGTGRYWFYKLDYLLWKGYVNGTIPRPRIEEKPMLTQKIDSFQFRDNRSIEHVEPRNPEHEVWAANAGVQHSREELIALKNQFGNLALISIRSNSSYNNQSTADKRKDFLWRSEKYQIESLKLFEMYQYEPWSIKNMEMHQEKMIGILKGSNTCANPT